MKSFDFLKEGFVSDAHDVHADNEVQMARQELFHAAEDALNLHKMLRHIDEHKGLEGWVSSKITLASDYLKTVRDYLEYELMSPSDDHMDVGGELVPAIDEAAEKFLYKKLRPGRYGGIDVIGFKEAPTDSVLAGQVLKHFIDNYETEEAAQAAHPDAEGYSNTFTDPPVSLSHLPGEDDPVPGGMYPDDLAEGLGKKIKRSLQGWGAFDKDSPADVVNKVRGQDTKTLQSLKTDTGHDTAEHSPQDLQQRAISRELKKREGQGVAEVKGHGESDPLKNREKYANQHNQGQVYKKTYPGDKVGMSKSYAYDIKRTGPKGVLPEQGVAEGRTKNPDYYDSEYARHHAKVDAMVEKLRSLGHRVLGIAHQGATDWRMSGDEPQSSTIDYKDKTTGENKSVTVGYNPKRGVKMGSSRKNNKIQAIAKKFRQNENNNYHTENALLLAQNFGTPDEIAMAKEALDYLNKHDGYDNSSTANRLFRSVYDITMKYYKNIAESRLVKEMSSGSVATVVNANAKKIPKSKIGSLFGGTYKQKAKK